MYQISHLTGWNLSNRILPRKMPTSFAKSSLSVNSRFKKKIEVKCWCEDLCYVFVSCTPENPGKKFWGCPNYKRQMMTLMQIVVVLLGAILFMLVLVVYKI
uniref:Uncharacterized protein n=1 Tax=Lactuca sativa TaxID=4236 RepID=A0A9R1X4A0_LACSA|nr:hypothetical protein LSAT_V11C600305370 [Lactuca sativa]